MKNKLLVIIMTAVWLSFSGAGYAQAPPLGTAAGFVLFSTNGAVGNTGISQVTGNVGTNNGANTGFGNVNGVMHVADGASAQCAADLRTASAHMSSAIPTFFPAPLLGNGQILTAGVYSIGSAATLDLDLTLDAQGNPSAVFIFKIGGSFSTGAASRVVLTNGALACNVFWEAQGLISMASGTIMKGTVIANNAAISIGARSTLEGRALSTTGAISVDGVLAYIPVGCGSPVLTGPAAPVLASAECYALFSSDGAVMNSGITHVTGDVGTNVGLTTGFDSAYVTGTIHPIPDISTAQCAADLNNVYTYLNTLPYDIQLLYPAQFGRSLVLTPHTYLLNAATSLTDTVFLNALGDSSAVFVILINGALSTSTYAMVQLTNGAQAKNVYWKIEGAVNINSNSLFCGTIVVNNGAMGPINTGVMLNGRAFTTTGALTTSAITAIMPPGCTSGPNPGTATWTGTMSNNWNTPGNWSGSAVPSCSTDAIIGTSAYHPVISAAASARNLVINPGTSLTVNSGSTLSLCGNLNNSGAASLGSGNILLQGTGTQTLSGTATVNNIEIAGNYIIGSSMADALSVTGILKKTSGTFTTNDKVTLMSTSTKTALIQENGGSLTGNITMQRYLGAVVGHYQFSSQMDNATVADLTGYSIRGTNGTGAWVTNGESTLERYAETSNFTSSLDSGYYNYTLSTNPLTDGEGFVAWIITQPVTLSIYGSPALGSVSYPVTRTAGEQPNITGWNLIGNPYPSPISWTAVKGLNPTLPGSCYIWKPTGATTGSYQTYNGTAGTNGVGNVISSGQGFWILAPANMNLSFNNTVRTQDLTPVFYKTYPAQDNEVRLTISSAADAGTEAVAYTAAGASDGYDADLDALSPVLPDGIVSPTIAYAIYGQDYLIHVTDAVSASTVMPLAIHIGAAGAYTVSASALNVPGLPVYLFDQLKNTYSDLSSDNVTINSPGNEDINGRYSVVFSKKADATAAGSNINVYGTAGAITVERAGDTGPATITVTNLLGQQLIHTTTTDYSVSLPVDISDAIYLVRVQQGSTETVRKVFVK